jgi:hypothetical protein
MPIDITNPNVDQYTPGFVGDLADIGLKDSISRQNTGETPIKFGAAVQDGPMIGTTTPGCQAFDGGRVIGFAKADFAIRPIGGNWCNPNDNDSTLAYCPGDTVHIVRDARMRQVAVEAVHRGDAVNVDDEGMVTGGGGTAVPGCSWESDTLEGELGIIQILIVGAGVSGAGTPGPQGPAGPQGPPGPAGPQGPPGESA